MYSGLNLVTLFLSSFYNLLNLLMFTYCSLFLEMLSKSRNHFRPPVVFELFYCLLCLFLSATFNLFFFRDEFSNQLLVHIIVLCSINCKFRFPMYSLVAYSCCFKRMLRVLLTLSFILALKILLFKLFYSFYIYSCSNLLYLVSYKYCFWFLYF